MEENQSEEPAQERPLTEQERRANLSALLGEKEADRFFFAAHESEYSSSSPAASTRTSSVNWKVVGVFAALFIAVLIIGSAVTGASVQEESIDPPPALVGRMIV